MGEQSSLYFDFLAQHARNAIEDRTPPFLFYDTSGKLVRDRYPPEFENWCAQNGKEPKLVERALADAAVDVLLLARAQDRRAEELFVRGLESPHEYVVAYSIEGLGRLQVNSSLAKIAKVFDRFPASAAKGLGMQLAWFSDIRAYELMQRVVPDERLRNFFLEGIAGQRKIEVERALRRTGRAPATGK